MSSYENPAFYISIFSSICLVASEILPFVPVQGNGIIHAILQCLSSFNKPPTVAAINGLNKKTTRDDINL